MKDMLGGGAPPVESIASFRVRIDSIHDATWQGIVEMGGAQYPFRSELELLRWVMEQYPVLRPNVMWTSNG